ncbi:MULTISPECIES: hypothetical protein [Streptomyces]|uniref:Uncharacterized protein n=1 Tax=Streptomyces hydrogenans TaxID=1873719 RepID=A0ABQ3PBW1_9ACTN|nr:MULTISPECIES: hypothetical protein [Streptomyces]GHE25439.1 hypothetical protein GCM10018784_74080 [Streptomyces hydrogenans]GHI22510.1 hypothetical protein Shyd_38810 [Streptomyces hydrogenans]
MRDDESFLTPTEALVHGGRAVVSADDGTVVGLILDTLGKGRTATFYVTPEQAQSVMRLFWTPRRIKEIGYERVSQEERTRIETELDVKDMGPWFSNRVTCPCGGVYGAFEFVEQGLRQHGPEWIGAVLSLRDAAVLRINPTQDAFCPDCGLILPAGHWYGMYALDGTLIYGCCSGEIPILT